MKSDKLNKFVTHMELQIFTENNSLIEIIILIAFMVSALLQLIYNYAFFSRLAFYKKPNENKYFKEPVSVIISAHNEDYNLRDNLPKILSQNYHDFEVIVVNHASTDDTLNLLEHYQRSHKNLKVVTIEQDLNFFSGKKFPLSIGIKSAKNDLLLLTDADCKPSSDSWIESMVSNYDNKTDVVLGYGPYNSKKGILNLFVKYDTFMVAMQYFSFALSGIPYMGVGRNLSYRKSLFMANKGFTSHYNIPSGDDDLFIMQVANKSNTKIELNKNSYMYSDPKTTFRNWFWQKKRHLTTNKEYSFKFKTLLGAFNITHLTFYLTFIILIFSSIPIIFPIVTFAVVMISKILIQKKAAHKLEENQILLLSLFGDIFYVLTMSYISISGLLRKQKNWK